MIRKRKTFLKKFKLIEYCSRLSQSEKYGYDPNKEQNFAGIGCACIDKSNNYKKGEKNINKCAHAQMLSDSSLIEYLLTVIEDPEANKDITESKKNAILTYDSKFNYTEECDNDIYYILNNLK